MAWVGCQLRFEARPPAQNELEFLTTAIRHQSERSLNAVFDEMSAAVNTIGRSQGAPGPRRTPHLGLDSFEK
jgi:hypothetical protein